MQTVEEDKLKKASAFNEEVKRWTEKVRGSSVQILGKANKGSGNLRRELFARWLYDKKTGESHEGKPISALGFRFHKYGAFLEYGAGRGYIVENGVIVRGARAWSSKTLRKDLKSLRYSNYVIRRHKLTSEPYAIIRRSPLPWLDPPINKNIEELGDIAGEYWGDQALKQVLDKFNKITIKKRYGKK